MWDANSDWSTLNDQSPAPAPGWANATPPMTGGMFGSSAPPPSMPPAPQMGAGGAGMPYRSTQQMTQQDPGLQQQMALSQLAGRRPFTDISGGGGGGSQPIAQPAYNTMNPATGHNWAPVSFPGGVGFSASHGDNGVGLDVAGNPLPAGGGQGGMMGGRPPMQGMGGGVGMAGGPPMAPQSRPMPSYGMGGAPPPMSPGNFGNSGPRFSGYGRPQGGFGSQGMPQRPQFSMGQNGGYNPQSMLGQLRSRGGPPSTGGPSNSPPSAFGDTRYEGQ